MNDDPQDMGASLDALRTQVANRATVLAESVTEGFRGFHIGAADYVVELKAPEGPSTGGGKQARQSICLVPRRLGYSVVVVGTLDPVTSTAEIRTFEYIAVLHELRFRRPLEINVQEYAALLAKLDLVLGVSRVRSKQVAAPPELLARRNRQATTSMRAVLLLVVVFVLATFVGFRVLRVLKTNAH